MFLLFFFPTSFSKWASPRSFAFSISLSLLYRSHCHSHSTRRLLPAVPLHLHHHSDHRRHLTPSSLCKPKRYRQDLLLKWSTLLQSLQWFRYPPRHAEIAIAHSPPGPADGVPGV